MSLPARTTHGTPDGVRAVSRLATINMELLTEFWSFTAHGFRRCALHPREHIPIILAHHHELRP